MVGYLCANIHTCAPHKEFIKQDPETPPIDCVIVSVSIPPTVSELRSFRHASAHDDFRRDVIWRANETVAPLVLLDDFSKPKVSEHGLAMADIEEDVFRLHVTMHDKQTLFRMTLMKVL